MYLLLLSLLFVAAVYGKPVDDGSLEGRDGGFIFQGDMIMKQQQIYTAVHGGDVDASYGYGLQKSNWYKWENGVVPYVLSSSFTGIGGITGPNERALKNAMAAWEQKTCIKFKKRTNEKDYVEVVDDGFGKCWSHVGRIGGKQQLSLGFACFTTGIAIHELGHAIGMHHEQSRPDRDNYVEIVWKNIKSESKHNFKKYSHSYIDSRGSPYDFDSIMHYGWNDFAKFPYFVHTIRSKTGAKFGQRSHISVQDAIQINKYYQCK